ncbi:VOC family protein [Pedomonas mirosovicensis]|uniref:VOC family protein n=1 Tax=Pedomonas mirosovicensis TaxID=2908641 RepID=UPI002169D8BA|nr:VOC family protein [Pedomonas mirosovicensis]MCH8685684.1 VOC family protein [Pedomonas mirosovicensis]
MAKKLTHVALHVRDLEASLAFYRDYCGLHVAHERPTGKNGARVVWMAAKGQDHRFVIVLLPGGQGREQPPQDFSHIGIAVDSRREVEAIAARAARDGRLAWPVRQEPSPVGTYCGVYDPDGAVVEFSYGQPLGEEDG